MFFTIFVIGIGKTISIHLNIKERYATLVSAKPEKLKHNNQQESAWQFSRYSVGCFTISVD